MTDFVQDQLKELLSNDPGVQELLAKNPGLASDFAPAVEPSDLSHLGPVAPPPKKGDLGVKLPKHDLSELGPVAEPPKTKAGLVQGVKEAGKAFVGQGIGAVAQQIRGASATDLVDPKTFADMNARLTHAKDMSDQDFAHLMADSGRMLGGAAAQFNARAQRIRAGKPLPDDLVDLDKLTTIGNPQDTATYKFGEGLQKFADEKFKPAPGWENSWTTKIAGAFGSTSEYFALGAMGPAVSIPAGSLVGVWGGAGQAMDSAIQAGATPQQIMQAAKLGRIPGATEQLPIEVIFERVPFPMWGKFASALGRGLAKATAEGGQELGQQFLQNVIEKYVYNPNKSLDDGLAESGVLGFIVGGTAAGVGEIARGRGQAAPGQLPAAPAALPPGGPSAAPRPQGPTGPLEGEILGPEKPAPAAPVPPSGNLDRPNIDLQANQPIKPQIAQIQQAVSAANAADIDPDVHDSAIRFRGKIYSGARHADAIDNILHDLGGTPDGHAQIEDEIGSLPVSDFGYLVDGKFWNGLTPASEKPVEAPAPQAPVAPPQTIAGRELPAPAPQNAPQLPGQPAALPVPQIQNLGQQAPTTDVSSQAVPIPLPDLSHLGPAVSGAGTRQSPAQINDAVDVARAGQEAVEATPAQAVAGNSKAGHAKYNGLAVSIQVPAGGTRKGIAKGGVEWAAPALKSAYGHVRGSKAKDGQPVDVFIGSTPKAPTAYIIDQIDPRNGRYDESKAAVGMSSPEEARAAYLSSFAPEANAESRIAAITPMPFDDFKKWVKSRKAAEPVDRAGVRTAREKIRADNRAALPPDQGMVGYPVIAMLKKAGGVKPGSPLAGELHHMGITHLKFPGLFNRNGISAADNFVRSEHPIFAGNGEYELNDKLDPDEVLRKLQDEVGGVVARPPDIEAAVKAYNEEQSAADPAVAEAQIHAVSTEHRMDLNDRDFRRAVDLLSKGYENTPDSAIERAILEGNSEVMDAYEKEVVDRSQESEIPWDDIGPSVESSPRAGQIEPDTAGAQGAAAPREEGFSEHSQAEAQGQDLSHLGPVAEKPAEPGADNKPQLVVPGAEALTQEQVDQRKVDAERKARQESKKIAPKKPQQGSASTALFGYEGEQTDIEAAATPAPQASKVDDSLVMSFKERLLDLNGGFRSIIDARRFAKEHGFDPRENQTAIKDLDEKIEVAIVLAARDIIAEKKSPADTYAALIELYGRQPRLGTRTSQSIADQAYSTPAPLAYLASRLAEASQGVVFEPTAGNGMLLIETDPKEQTVYANEMNGARTQNLSEQGFEVSEKDATDDISLRFKPDVVIANPPFGAVKDTRWEIGDHTYREIDQAIAVNALSQMKDRGHAVLIMGGVKAEDPKARGEAYNGQSKRTFYARLYRDYNVTDHFTVSGDLYERQGAAWPVDVIVIDGKGKSARRLPAVNPPTIYKTWDELKEKLNGQSQAVSGADSQPHGEAAAPGAGRPVEAGGDEPSAGTALEQRPDLGRPSEEQGDHAVRGGGDNTERLDLRAEPAERPRTETLEPGKRDERSGPDEPASDLSALFDDLLDEHFGASAEAAAKPVERVRKAIAKEEPPAPAKMAVKETISGLDDVLSGLSALFNDQSRVGSGLVFDEQTYAKAKPFFEKAMAHFKEAAKSASEAMRLLMNELVNTAKFGREAIQNIKPYILRFVEEYASKPKAAKKERASVGQSEYAAQSKGDALGTLVPTNMADATREALKKLGDVDAMVMKALGYTSEELAKALKAEQVDAVALAIHNIESGDAFIIGDQTGIGKGRVVAAVLRYAMKHGKVPIFVTEKPNLYGDMIRDMNDIGLPAMLGRAVNPFMTNSGEKIPLDDEAMSWFESAQEAKDAGVKIPPRAGVFLQVAGGEKHKSLMREMVSRGDLGEYDALFTTYDQMNTVKGDDTLRRSLLGRLASNAMIVFDESHNAGEVKTGWKKKGATLDRSEYTRELAAKAWGLMFSSATYAKRPGVMDFYARTDLGKAVDQPKMLGELISRGGVPLQQIVASMLAKAGQYLRRERSFDGVDYDVEITPVSEETYDKASGSIANIHHFDEALKTSDEFEQWKNELAEEGETFAGDDSTGKAGVVSTNFTSVMHNLVSQLGLALKADAAADRAIRALKEEGQKPVIGLANTLESFLKDYTEQEELKIGDPITLTFAALMHRYLERTRRVAIKDPDGNRRYEIFPLDRMGDGTRALYDQASESIENAGLEALPISPIDWIEHRLTEAGYKVGEITGRSTIVDYSGQTPVLAQRPAISTKPAGKTMTVKRFNNGAVDALVINRSGSTGLSLHASPKTGKDLRRRRMILAQAELNIDTYMQMLGRVHRTGQVIPPAYAQLVADIPSEARPAAVTAKKMASLNANTTANRNSVLSGNVPDFLNLYGDRVAYEMLREDEGALAARLGLEISTEGDNPSEDAARKLTGRLILLQASEQREVLDDLINGYNALVEQADSLGENLLEAKAVDTDAKLIEKTQIREKVGESPFTDGVYIEKVEVKAIGRAMTMGEIASKVAEGLGKPIPEGDDHLVALRKSGRAAMDAKVEAATKEHKQYIEPIIRGLKEAEARGRRQAEAEATRTRFRELLNVAYPGALVSLELSPGVNIPAYVLSVSTRKGDNPLALSRWMIRFATPTSGREVTMAMSQLVPYGTPHEQNSGVKAIAPPDWSMNDKQAEEVFAEARKHGRETRYIVTGNIPSGYDLIKRAGQIVTFTRDDGTISPGIMQARGFDFNKYMEDRPVRFSSGDQVVSFIQAAPDAKLMSLDTLVDISRSERYGWMIEIKASLATGGIYYLDPKVRELSGDQFVKRGGKMRYEAAGPSDMKRVVDALIQAGATFETREHQDAATDIIRGREPRPTETPVPSPQAPPKRAATTFDLGETIHGKTGAKVFVAKMTSRLERGEYERVNATAKRHGGFYSPFKGGDAIPGFQFSKESARAAFVAEVSAKPEEQASARPVIAGANLAISPAAARAIDAAREAIEIIRRIAPDYYEITFHDKITAPRGSRALKEWNLPDEATEVAGAIDKLRGIIQLSNSPKFDLQNTAFHEAGHSVEDFATKEERKLLRHEMPRLRSIMQHDFNISEADAAKISEREVIVSAFAAWAQGRYKGIHVGIRRFFDRIAKLIRQLRNMLQGHGFNTAEDFFEAVYQGDLKKRAEAENEGPDVSLLPAWHGTRAKNIEKFSTDYMGTGEGAQMYGWGLYFTGKREIADHYRQKLAGLKQMRVRGLDQSLQEGPLSGETVNGLRKWLDENIPDLSISPAPIRDMTPERVEAYVRSNAPAALKGILYSAKFGDIESGDKDAGVIIAGIGESAERSANRILGEGLKDVGRERGYLENLLRAAVAKALLKSEAVSFDRPGAAYHVDLKPEEGEYLLWDKPLSEQSEKVKAALAALGIKEPTGTLGEAGSDNPFSAATADFRPPAWRGERAYRKFSKKVGGDKEASLALRDAGIRGIKYLAGESRSAGEGTYNYVIFDGSDVEVVEQYSIGRRPPQVLDPNRTFDMRDEGNIIKSIVQSRIMRKLMPSVSRAFPISETDLRQRLQDKEIYWKHLATELETQHGVLAEPLNIYQAMTVFRSKSGKKLQTFLKTRLDPLLKSMKDRGVKRESSNIPGFDDFLAARHAPERNATLRQINPNMADPSGMSDQDASQIMADIRAAGKMNAYREVAKHFDQIVSETRDLMLSSQLIDQETYDRLRNQWRYYAPLRGFEEDPEAAAGEFGGTGRGYDVRGPEFHRALGRDSRSDSPLSYMMQQAAATIVRAGKNSVDRRIAAAVRRFPNKQVWELDKVGYTRAWDPKTKQVVTRRLNKQAQMWEDADNVFVAKEMGKPVYITINHEGLARGARGLGMEHVNFVLRGMMALSRWQRTMITGLSPEFWETNFMRDLQEALINLSDVNKPGVGHNNPPTTNRIKYIRTKVMKDLPFAMQALLTKTGPLAQRAQEFEKEGGRILFYGVDSIQTYKDKIDHAVRTDVRAKAWRAGDKFLKGIEFVNGAVENAMRLSVYHNLVRHGWSSERAAAFAKELTVNFDRHGEWGPAINAYKLFYNARTQGAVRMAIGLRNPKIQKIVGSLFLLSFLHALLNYWAAGDDDNGKNRWDELPGRQKYMGVTLMYTPWAPGKPVTLPLSYGYGMFAGLGAIIADYSRHLVTTSGKYDAGEGLDLPSAVAELFTSAINSLSPVDIGPEPIHMAAPSAAAPLVDMATNMNTWGDAVYPPKDRGPLGATTQPDSETYFSTVSPTARDITHWLNENTGGDEHKSGAVDVSPETLEVWWSYLFGGLGRFGGKMVNTTTSLLNGDPVQPKDMIFNRFYYPIDDRVKEGVYYALRDRIQVVDEQAKDRKYGLKKAKENNPIEFSSIPAFKAAEKARSKVKEQLNRLETYEDERIPIDQRHQIRDSVRRALKSKDTVEELTHEEKHQYRESLVEYRREAIRDAIAKYESERKKRASAPIAP